MTPYRHLPEPLRRLPRYLPWQARPRPNGRIGKVPLAARGGTLRPVDPLAPEHWSTLDEAHRWVPRGLADGVGLVVTPRSRLTVIDLDNCRTAAGDLSAEAASLLARYPDAYAEISPGGLGVHLVVPGRTPRGWRRRPGLDILDRGFVTVTGHVLRPGRGWQDASAELARWHRELAPRPASTPLPPSRSGPPLGGDDLLRRALAARSGGRFAELWSGGLAGYPSRSEGDLALTLMLLYWGGEAMTDEEVVALVGQSGRAREKWTGPYAARTVALARRLRGQA